MKKILLLLIVLSLNFPAFAINWQQVESRRGKTAYVDTDSITEYKNYYFYNIKVFNEHTHEFVIITIQSRKNNALSSRIKYYKEDEYKTLKGNYENIVENITNKLEPVEYGSIVFTCYSYVKSIMSAKQTQIEF